MKLTCCIILTEVSQNSTETLPESRTLFFPQCVPNFNCLSSCIFHKGQDPNWYWHISDTKLAEAGCLNPKFALRMHKACLGIWKAAGFYISLQISGHSKICSRIYVVTIILAKWTISLGTSLFFFCQGSLLPDIKSLLPDIKSSSRLLSLLENSSLDSFKSDVQFQEEWIRMSSWDV